MRVHTHDHLDAFPRGQFPTGDGARFATNISETYQGYEFDVVSVHQSRQTFTAPADEGHFLILQPGIGATAKITEGPATISKGHYFDTPLMEGDLIHLPPGASAEVNSFGGLFWRIRIKGKPEDFIYKCGITLLRFCTNTKGGCNTGSAAFNRNRDWRMMLYSGHDKGQPVPDGFVPKLELHVPLINATSSTPHWHPAASKNDGLPQHELYLMLDHQTYGLEVDNTPPKLMVYPGPVPSLSRNQQHAVNPGDAFSIFTETGHQLHGGLVIVAAFPARFDLANEIPVAP